MLISIIIAHYYTSICNTCSSSMKERERKQQITAIQVLNFALCMIVARLKRKENCNLMRAVEEEDEDEK